MNNSHCCRCCWCVCVLLQRLRLLLSLYCVLFGAALHCCPLCSRELFLVKPSFNTVLTLQHVLLAQLLRFVIYTSVCSDSGLLGPSAFVSPELFNCPDTCPCGMPVGRDQVRAISNPNPLSSSPPHHPLCCFVELCLDFPHLTCASRMFSMMLQSPSRFLARSIAAFSHVGASLRGKSGSFCRAFLSALIHVFPLSYSCLLLSMSLVFTFLPMLLRNLFLVSFSAAAHSLLFLLGTALLLCLLSTALPLCCSSFGLPLLVVFLIVGALLFFLFWFLCSPVLQLLVKVLLLLLQVLLFLPLPLSFI